METYLIIYLAGIVLVGLPLAKISLWLYEMEEKLDWSPNVLWLKLLRNFLHPGSFILLPDCERGRPRDNYKMNYEGPIGLILNRYSDDLPTKRLFYLIVTSLAWPVRVFFILMVWVIIGALTVIGGIIASPFLLIYGACKFLKRSKITRQRSLV